ncbi:hypothetical protein B0H63DRAFT_189716 [Podospora didyma]|uniref:Rhodopsin domain-containing protein n=1 Tax=Podospora didyma TaxID=330526 RepID=A0AAE0NR54_9PEZI|nr:hypothetical protein B0H63DRAFT_189716 [Podospora didyma]
MWRLGARLELSSSTPSTGGPSRQIEPFEYCELRLAGKLPAQPIPNLGSQTAMTIWTLTALATVFLAVRVYCKEWRLRGLWWDDWVLILSWACFITNSSLCQKVIDLGFGKFPCDIPQENMSAIGLIGGDIGATFSILAILWSKSSFGITILRLTTGKLHAFVLFLVVSMNIAMLLQVFFVWFKCNPVSKTWNPMEPGTCWDTHVSNGYGVFSGVFSGVCDIVLAFLPWKIVWNLKMQTREKLGVAIAMSLGVFASATAFVKSAMLLTMGDRNFTYDGSSLLVWTAAEIGTTIMASCIPVMRVFVRTLHKEARSGRQAGPDTGSTPTAATSLRGRATVSESSTDILQARKFVVEYARGKAPAMNQRSSPGKSMYGMSTTEYV